MPRSYYWLDLVDAHIIRRRFGSRRSLQLYCRTWSLDLVQESVTQQRLNGKFNNLFYLLIQSYYLPLVIIETESFLSHQFIT